MVHTCSKTTDTTTSWQQLDFQTPLRNKGWMQFYFHKHGKFVASYPIHVILVSLLVTGIIGIGLINYQVETEPQNLWMYPDSRAVQDLSLYQQLFGPVPRVERIIFTRSSNNASMLQADILAEILDIQNEIINSNVETAKGNISFG